MPTAKITPKYRNPHGVLLGELTVKFFPSYEGIVHALMRAVEHDQYGAGRDDLRDLPGPAVVKLLRDQLRLDGMLAYDDPTESVSATDWAAYRQWATRHADKVWTGPKPEA
jgi:hypothetical protein